MQDNSFIKSWSNNERKEDVELHLSCRHWLIIIPFKYQTDVNVVPLEKRPRIIQFSGEWLESWFILRKGQFYRDSFPKSRPRVDQHFCLKWNWNVNNDQLVNSNESRMNYDKRTERGCEKKRNVLILCGQLSEVSHKELLLHFLTVDLASI